MRIRSPFLSGLFVSLLAAATHPVFSQNLLVNSGFDRDLAGWTSRIQWQPDPSDGGMSSAWTATDIRGSAVSGGLALHANSGVFQVARMSLDQCVASSEGRLVTFGGKFLTTRLLAAAGTSVDVAFFPTADCSGASAGFATASSLSAGGHIETSSNGQWLPASSFVLSSPGTRSMRVSVTVSSTGTSFLGPAYVDAVADDVFATIGPASVATWMIPSAAWAHGAAGSYWTTRFTLSNPGTTDAAVTLKWLGHDVDGRAGVETAYVVRAGETLSPDEETWWVNHPEDWGAILVTSSSPSLVVQSETSTPVPGGGTVGETVPALGSADFAGASPKTIAPVRENASFRTNLVVANATESPLTAHVALYAVDGTTIGARDVALPPLGMTQLTRVAALLGAVTLDLGRISVSTPTPGGLVAAYASIIDNTTNDPRTVLPRDAVGGLNLLLNPGFDRDLGGWTAESHLLPDPAHGGEVSATWMATDEKGNSASGGLSLHANAFLFGSAAISLSQCVAVSEGFFVSFGAKFLTASQAFAASTSVDVKFFASTDCRGVALGSGTATSLPSDGFFDLSSNGLWLSAASEALSIPGTHSLLAGVSANAATPGLGLRFGSVDALADDVFVTAAAGAITTWLLPATAWIHGDAGSYWATRFMLCNLGPTDATVTLKWLGHDLDGRFGLGTAYVVRSGQTFVPDEWVNHPEDYGAILVFSPSSALVVNSETSTSLPDGSGTVGQALPALGSADFAGVSLKTLAPIRENASFRTNLVLANATEALLTARVTLYAADGTRLGARDVDLPPLGMTQLNRVAVMLGSATLDGGRIDVSTPTPGGLVAAYASVIDNVTNDPRTILPR